jgi:hypothetical protein
MAASRSNSERRRDNGSEGGRVASAPQQLQQKAEEQDTLARTRQVNENPGTAIGHARHVGLWRMRYDVRRFTSQMPTERVEPGLRAEAVKAMEASRYAPVFNLAEALAIADKQFMFTPTAKIVHPKKTFYLLGMSTPHIGDLSFNSDEQPTNSFQRFEIKKHESARSAENNITITVLRAVRH